MPETIRTEHLQSFAQRKMRSRKGGITRVRVSDPKMELPPLALFTTMVAEIKGDMPDASEYTENGEFDCDDFAFIFKGLVTQWYRKNRADQLPFAIGVAWGDFNAFSKGQFHALNWLFLADDKLLYWIEPQHIHSSPLDDAMAKFEKTLDRVDLLIV